MKIKFKKLHEGALIPKKATEGSAAYDLCVPEDTIVKPGRQIIPLGFAMEIPIGYEALIDARSGFSSKGMEGHLTTYVVISPSCSREPDFMQIKPKRFDCDVIQGKIDSDYRDGVGVIIHNRSSHIFTIKAGTRVAQMSFLRVYDAEWEETDTLSETERKGGFGHTGTK